MANTTNTRMHHAQKHDHDASTRSGSGLNVIAGIWLIAAPFILGYSAMTQAFWNDVTIGAIVLVLGLVGASIVHQTWSRWINMLAGAWLFFSPFIFDYAGVTNALWNDMILGVLIVAFSAWSATFATLDMREAKHQPQAH